MKPWTFIKRDRWRCWKPNWESGVTMGFLGPPKNGRKVSMWVTGVKWPQPYNERYIQQLPPIGCAVSWTGLRWVPDFCKIEKKRVGDYLRPGNCLKSFVFLFCVFCSGIGRADGKGRQKKEVSAFFGRLRIPKSPSCFKQLFINEVYEVDTSNITFWRWK